MYFFSTVHAKAANSNPTNYIFLRLAINTLFIEHIDSPFFQNLKIGLECLLLEYLESTKGYAASWFIAISSPRSLFDLCYPKWDLKREVADT